MLILADNNELHLKYFMNSTKPPTWIATACMAKDIHGQCTAKGIPLMVNTCISH